jgi:hypothetical protein
MNLHEAIQILKIKDPYDVSEIKKKYKRETLKCHPDRGGDPKKFILVKDAYDLLIQNSKKPKNSVMDEIDERLLRYYLYYTRDKPIFRLPIIEKYINKPIQEHLSQYKEYVLKPSLSRLLRREVYYMSEHDIYIPLWHSELIFYDKIKVTIIPILPENVTIDDNNDIWVDGDKLEVDGIIYHEGIPRIKNNIYDVSELGSIHKFFNNDQ